MTADWDRDRGGREHWIAWLTQVMVECYRVLKPGAYGLVWAIPRTSHWTATALENAGFEIRDVVHHLFGNGLPKTSVVDGRSTNLKPAAEHWILVRKPLAFPSLIKNIQQFGTGSLEVDRSRGESGRFPPNVVFSHTTGCTKEHCDEGCAIGELRGQHPDALHFFPSLIMDTDPVLFRYIGRVSQKERNLGCENLPKQHQVIYGGRADRHQILAANHHPTVKSLRLMRWLCRLVNPPGGVVIDPFAGSGSTACAAVLEGLSYIAIEQDPAYATIAHARIAFWQRKAKTTYALVA